jgi:uncharacterized protein YjbJ (UPF0337 family)
VVAAGDTRVGAASRGKGQHTEQLAYCQSGRAQFPFLSKQASTIKGENKMNPSTNDEIKGNLHEVKGKIKETAGKVTNNPGLETEGKAEQTAGKIEKKVGQVEKAFGK